MLLNLSDSMPADPLFNNPNKLDNSPLKDMANVTTPISIGQNEASEPYPSNIANILRIPEIPGNYDGTFPEAYVRK
jgi:hypothetical protein